MGWGLPARTPFRRVPPDTPTAHSWTRSARVWMGRSGTAEAALCRLRSGPGVGSTPRCPRLPIGGRACSGVAVWGKDLSWRYPGRHYAPDEICTGRHRAPDEASQDNHREGRHRVALQRAAISSLLAASGTMAAAALTAIVLSGQQDPSIGLSGQLDAGGDSLADRQQEPRPVSGTSRGSAPSADEVAPVVSGPPPGAGMGTGAGLAPGVEQDTGAGLGGAGLGAMLQLSISEALVQLLDGAPAPGSATPSDGVPGGSAGAGGPSGSVVAPAGTPSVNSTHLDSAPALSPQPATGSASPAGEPRPPGGPAPAPSEVGDDDGRAPVPVPEREHGRVTAPPRPVIEPGQDPVVEQGPPVAGPEAEDLEHARPPGDRGRRAGDQALPGPGDIPAGEGRGR